MGECVLKYGRSEIVIDADERFDVLGGTDERAVLSDAEIGEALDSPVDSKRLEELVGAGETVLIVVPDATRQTGSGQIVNLLVRRLIANGSAPHEIAVIFATGIHRKVTDAEKAEILTPFIAQRIKTLDHDPRDLATLVNLGSTTIGIPIELNRAVVEFDHTIVVGGVTFHYFAGFTGGRKLICPGLASTRTISRTHKLAFDCETMGRRAGVDTGLLDGNAVHEAFMECVSAAAPSFAITSITDDEGAITEIFCGDWISSHREACEAFAHGRELRIAERRRLVIASCGGYPYDLNMIQAHKTLDTASRACEPGGTIVLIAHCGDGLGRADFLDWFGAVNSRDLAARLCEKYQVNGQTAWNLMRIAESYDVQIVTDLDATTSERMRLKKLSPTELTKLVQNGKAPGYILPRGSKFHILESSTLG